MARAHNEMPGVKNLLAAVAIVLAIAAAAGFAGMVVVIVSIWREGGGQPAPAGPSLTTLGWVIAAMLPVAALGFLALGLTLLNRPADSNVVDRS
jgi:hypothetical protein